MNFLQLCFEPCKFSVCWRLSRQIPRLVLFSSRTGAWRAMRDQTRTLPNKVDAMGCAKLLSPSLKEEGHAYTPTRTLCRRRHTRCEDKPAPPSNIRFPRTPSSKTVQVPSSCLSRQRLRVCESARNRLPQMRTKSNTSDAHETAPARTDWRACVLLRAPRDTTPSPSAQDPSSKKARARDGSNARGEIARVGLGGRGAPAAVSAARLPSAI
ncbi:hypothetical protein DFH09DRAFT_440906 [Mycena vulgaris]|nr:hypothetical protein DFH09DRAFT_440906 [Mycena vulgaris]